MNEVNAMLVITDSEIEELTKDDILFLEIRYMENMDVLVAKKIFVSGKLYSIERWLK